MNQQEWDQWKALPATAEFFKFLGDYRGQIGRNVALAVSDGEFVAPDVLDKDTEVCAIYKELETLDLEHIESFYKEEIEEAA